MIYQVKNCQYCNKRVDISEIFCPHCMRDLPQNIEEYEFDFIKRQIEDGQVRLSPTLWWVDRGKKYLSLSKN